MKFVLKCNGKTEPLSVDPKNVCFQLEIDDGVCDSFCFRLTSEEKTVCEKNFSGGFFPILRLDAPLKENASFSAYVEAYRNKKKAGSAKCSFQTAFIPQKAKWIGYSEDTDAVLKFQKKFVLGEKGENYRLFACGLGFYDIFINGVRLNGYFKPLVGDYCERKNTGNPLVFPSVGYKIFADIYNIDALVRVGENEIVATVGDGYFRNVDKVSEDYVSYGEKRLIFEVVSGKEVIAYSDCDTLVAKTPFSSGLFLGDRGDFSKEDESSVRSKVLPALTESFSFSSMRSDRVLKEIVPKNCRRFNWSDIYDFGINHSGGLSFSVKGKRGSVLTVRYAEVENQDGSLNFVTSAWSDTDKRTGAYYEITQKASCILSGGVDKIEPLYSWRCYRYASVECTDLCEITDLKSLFIVGDLSENASFRCSEEIFNEIWQKGTLTLLDNARSGLLTDCPHREKRPYTGDGQIVAQRADGFIPYTVPCINGGGGYAWSNAVVVVPMELYKMTGDRYYVEKAYLAVKKWIAFLTK